MNRWLIGNLQSQPILIFHLVQLDFLFQIFNLDIERISLNQFKFHGTRMHVAIKSNLVPIFAFIIDDSSITNCRRMKPAFNLNNMHGLTLISSDNCSSFVICFGWFSLWKWRIWFRLFWYVFIRCFCYVQASNRCNKNQQKPTKTKRSSFQITFISFINNVLV